MPATEVVSDAQIIRVEYYPSQAPESGLDLVAQARGLTVASQTDADRAGEIVQALAAVQKKVREFHDPLAQSAHEHHRLITAARTAQLNPLTSATAVLMGNVAVWRREEQERLRREAEEQQRREQKRLDDEALELAARLKAEGVDEDAALEAAAPAPAYVPPPPAPKIAGMRTSKHWDYEITGMRLLCGLICAGKVPTSLLEPKRSACLAFAKMHGAEGNVPGLRMFEVSTIGRKG